MTKRGFRKVNYYVLRRMARFLNRKSQRYYRLKFADSYNIRKTTQER